MKFLHPFPARMAPEILDEILSDIKRGETVLDPMCGSGTVLAKALANHRNAIGLDLDPLAVLLARALTVATDRDDITSDALAVLASAERRATTPNKLPWIGRCEETSSFVDYWFGEEQANALARLTAAINAHKFSSAQSKRLCQIALSRTIITKHSGASLAWDISHSRPHKMKEADENDYDVFEGFRRAANIVADIAAEHQPTGTGRVLRADARAAHSVVTGVDHIVTSPPYLNAIDYLRGHKFSLIWFGHTIPALRETRAANIGAERAKDADGSIDQKALFNRLRRLRNLPTRQTGHLMRYAYDLKRMIGSAARTLREKGSLTVVIGNSTVRGTYVENSEIFKWLATQGGFKFKREYTRRIPAARRYLPESRDTDLGKRMRHEVVQTYVRAA